MKPKFKAGQVVMVTTECGDKYPVKLDHITSIGTRECVAWMDSIGNVEYQNEMRPLTAKECGQIIKKCPHCGSDPLAVYKLRRLEQIDHVIHGVSCKKAQHLRGGQLHGEDDDEPFNVDGVKYCGRCHVAL